MSSPGEFHNSLPPVTKAFATMCLATTAAAQLGLFGRQHVALIYEAVFSHYQVWRLITSFFFLGKFSINFGIRLFMILRYGVQLEKGPFERRTADFLWIVIFGALTLLVLSAIPFLRTPFPGISLVFMLLYVWSREFPNAQINLYGLVARILFPMGNACAGRHFRITDLPDLLGIVAGHLYYFLMVLYPLDGGKKLLKTPSWHRFVQCYRIGFPPHPLLLSLFGQAETRELPQAQAPLSEGEASGSLTKT